MLGTKFLGVLVLAFAVMAKLPTAFLTRGVDAAGHGISACGTKVSEFGDTIAKEQRAEETAQARAVADVLKPQSDAIVTAVGHAAALGDMNAQEQTSAASEALKTQTDVVTAAVDRATTTLTARQENLEQELNRELAVTGSLSKQLAQLDGRVQRFVEQSGSRHVDIVPIHPYAYPCPPPFSHRR